MSGMSGSRETNRMRPEDLRFDRYSPGPHLSRFVRNYWTLQAADGNGLCGRQHVTPDGCIDIIFRRRTPTEAFTAFVVGAMTRPIFEDLAPRAEYLGIRFAPGGFGHFLPVPAGELTDRIVPLEYLSAPSRLIEAVANAPDRRTRLLAIEEGLGRWLRSTEPEPILAAALDTLLASGGMVSVVRLAGLAGRSPRHLRRVFRERVGVGPKLFCRIIRFKGALHTLRHRPQPDLLQVALEAGYYDQAHFIHDFDRFYGSSPSTVCRDRGF